MCIEENVLIEAIQGALTAERMKQVGLHLKECESCREKIRQLAAARRPVSPEAPQVPKGERTPLPPSPPVAPELPLGSFVGRYSIIDLLGTGGMGVVYSAYDPELDRKIALKVLRRDIVSGDTRARLFREAQAIARLSHPNVIAVHDVGITGDLVFVAMEFVSGGTLSQWIKERPRGWQEIVQMFLYAGRGLVAAHAAGLTHRDFKPDNVLVGREGRVRVTDFGLARSNASPDPSLAASIGTDPKQRTPTNPRMGLNSPLTVEEMLIGTPAYMAPEQLWGRQADPRSDQFSFCVALYEELYGQRPFSGSTVAQLRTEIEAGRITPPPRATRVPPWVYRALAQGLAADPDCRYGSMEKLLSALKETPGSIGRRRSIFAVLGLVLFAGVIGTYAFTRRGASSRTACAAPGRGTGGIWDLDRKATIHRAFAATGQAFAAQAWDFAERALNQYSHDWERSWSRACQAVEAGQLSRDDAALQNLCLDQRAAELRAVTQLFSTADRDVVSHSTSVIGTLSPIAECEEVSGLGARFKTPRDASTRLTVERVRAEVTNASIRLSAGKYREGLELAKTAVDRARETGYRPALGEALLLQGQLEAESGDANVAERALQQAHRIAIEEGYDRLAVRASSRLVFVAGIRLGKQEPAYLWADEGFAHLEHLGVDPLLEAELRVEVGRFLQQEGNYPQAKQMLQRALQRRESALGAEHPQVATILNQIGDLDSAQGHYADAIEAVRRTLDLRTKSLGSRHPEVIQAKVTLGELLVIQERFGEASELMGEVVKRLENEESPDRLPLATGLLNLALLEMEEGRYEQSQAHLDRAMAISERAVGSEHPLMALVLDGLGSLASHQRNFSEAAADHQRALRIRQQASREDDLSRATTLAGLGVAWRGLRRFREARSAIAEALSIREEKLGVHHPLTGFAHCEMGKLSLAIGKALEAVPHFQAALDISAKTVVEDAPQVGVRLAGLGMAYLQLGNAETALPLLERSKAIAAMHFLDDHELAERQFALAKALWLAKGDTQRASQLAAQAKTGFSRLGTTSRRARQQVDAWMAERKLRPTLEPSADRR